MGKWCTVAPILYVDIDNHLPLVFEFSENISLRRTPEWVVEEFNKRDSWLRDHIPYVMPGLSFVYEFEYEPEHETQFVIDTENIIYLNLALWIVCPSKLVHIFMLHAQMVNGEWNIHMINGANENVDRFLIGNDKYNVRMTVDRLEKSEHSALRAGF